MTIDLLGAQARPYPFMWGLGEGFPCKGRDVLNAFQSQGSWLALGVREAILIPLCIPSNGQVPELPTHKTTFENFVFVSLLIGPSPILAVPQGPHSSRARSETRAMMLYPVVLHPASLWNYWGSFK